LTISAGSSFIALPHQGRPHLTPVKSQGLLAIANTPSARAARADASSRTPQLQALDDWIAEQMQPFPSRPEAVRRQGRDRVKAKSKSKS